MIPKPRIRLWAGRAAAVLMGLMLSLTALEITLRLWEMLLRRRPAPGPGLVRILCLGESSTAPTFPDVSWPAQLQRLIDEDYGSERVAVVNEGVPATNSSAILGRLPLLLDRYRPQIVIAMMGSNDGEWYATAAPPGRWRRLMMDLRIVRTARYFLHEFPKAVGDSIQGNTRMIRTQDEAASFLRRGRSDLAWGSVRGYLRQYPDPEPQWAVDLFLQFHDRSIFARLKDPKSGVRAPCSSLWLEGVRLESAGRLEELEALARRALRRSPGDPEARLLLGEALLDRRPCQAVAELEAAHAETSPQHNFRMAIGSDLMIGYWQCGRLADARREARMLLSEFPGCNFAQRWAIDLAVASGDIEAAGKMMSLPGGRAGIEFARKTHNEVVRHNFLWLSRIAKERMLRLVVMQYPLRDAGPLRALFQDEPDVLVVSNSDNFRAALAREPDAAIFRDHCAHDFGHCTARGNRLIAGNLFYELSRAGLLPAPGGDRRASHAKDAKH